MYRSKMKSAEQFRTEELFDDYLECKWTPQGQMIANIFKAFPISAFTVDHIEKMVQAINCLLEKPDLQRTLTKLARAKVLRSRRSQGHKLFEVNY